MAGISSACGVCKNLQIIKPSEFSCAECDLGLCGDCRQDHIVSKATRNHKTVALDACNTSPTKDLQIAQICKIHNEKYEVFCTKHDYPCCKKCLETHNDCKNLTDINEIILNVKTSNAFYEIEQNLSEVIDNIKRIRTRREDNLTSLKITRREIQSEIEQTRADVNNHLDKLQSNIMKELLEIELNESTKMKRLSNTLKKKELEITKYLENLVNIKQHASDIQTFLSMKHIEKHIVVEEKFIQSISKSEVKIACQINKSLQQFTDRVHTFGEINVISVLYDFSIHKRKDRQAQIMVPCQSQFISGLTVTLTKRISTDLSYVRGCSLLPGGWTVFSCYDKDTIRCFDSSGYHYFEIDNIGFTFDVMYIGNDNLAVTSGGSCMIKIIDIKNKKLNKTINTRSENEGLIHKDGHLIYCARKNGLQMISLVDESITNVINNVFSNYAYVTAFRDKLFYTNPDKNSVTCCDYHGNEHWTYCDNDILRYPLGISVDNVGNVFVVGYDTHNVVVISSDGKRCRQLLSRKDELCRPQVLHYDQSTNVLLVANRQKSAFLYEVKRK